MPSFHEWKMRHFSNAVAEILDDVRATLNLDSTEFAKLIERSYLYNGLILAAAETTLKEYLGKAVNNEKEHRSGKLR